VKEVATAKVGQGRPSKAQLAREQRAERARAVKEAKDRKQAERSGKETEGASSPA
jgi:hypothetical protein